MSAFRNVEIRKQATLFQDDFCKINELIVSHMKSDGSMSAEQRRLVFDRGNAAAVLLFNTDTNCVVLVNQFRAPTLGNDGVADGWLTEAAGGGRLTEVTAGIVDKPESPIRTAIRETREETGYAFTEPREDSGEQGGDLRLIAKFFPSPGASSELIYLYFAKVTNGDKRCNGGGIGDEDIAVKEMPVEELFGLIRQHRIEDPKLLIGALWLQEELKELGRKPLATTKVKYSLKDFPDLSIGYITGPIHNVCDEHRVSIWVNSENEDMIMDRFNGKTISAIIRFLGAAKDDDGNLTEDTIADHLASKLGGRAPVKIGTVIQTGSGNLEATHRVDKVFHVAAVKGARAALHFPASVGMRAMVPMGFKADPNDLELCVANVLAAADKSNGGVWRKLFRRRHSESILFPIIGAGDGGVRLEDAVPQLVKSAIAYLRAAHSSTTIKEVYFLAYTAAHKHALDVELNSRRGLDLTK
jgi:nudix-type nucleoside diphosphatase (YffH/AdpP family)